MEWKRKTITLPDDTELTIQETLGEINSGVVFALRDLGCREARGVLEKMAELLAYQHIAVITPVFREEELPDRTRFGLIMESLKEYCRPFEPWFGGYAEGRFGHPLFLYLNDQDQSRPLFLGSLFFFPDNRIEMEEEPAFVKVRTSIEGYDAIIERRFYSPATTFPFDNDSDDGEESDYALRSALFFIRHFAFCKELLWKSMFDIIDRHRREVPFSGYAKVLCDMVLQGCGDAAVRLGELKKTITEEMLSEQVDEQSRNDLTETKKLLDRTENRIKRQWKPAWPEGYFWEVVAADTRTAPKARRDLFLTFIGFSGQEQKRISRRMEEEAREGHSYAAIYLGLLEEMKYPVDVEKMKGFYQTAAEYGDPEGDYRIGRFMEYGLRQPKEAVKFYKKASDQGYLPAELQMVLDLEWQENIEDKHWILRREYESIAEKTSFSFIWKRLGELWEEEGRFKEAEEAYEMVDEYGDDCEEKAWSYQVGTDKYSTFFDEGCLPNRENTADLMIRSGKTLMKKMMDDPDLSLDNMTAVERFREAAEYELGEELREKEDIEKCFHHCKKYGIRNVQAGEAVYYAGLCWLKGIGCRQDAGKALSHFRLAGELGYEEAKEYTALWDEADGYLQSVLAAGKRASGEERRKEALYRMRFLTWMGLDESVYENFAQKGTISFIYDGEFIDFPDPESERDRLIQKEICYMQGMHHATAYLVLITSGFLLTRVSVFYVADDVSDWEFEREEFMNMAPYAYAFDIQYDEKDVCAEIGPIGITVSNGYVDRSW